MLRSPESLANPCRPTFAEFIKTPKEQQLAYIQQLLDGLASPDAEVRFTNARHLLYIAQGRSRRSRF